MAVLCICWGLQQVAIKAVALDIPPIFQVSLRSGIASILVFLLMVARKEPLFPRDGTWRPGLLVGLFFALEFLFIGEALRFTTASHTVVFLYTAPIFAAIGLNVRLPSEKLLPLQWMGIALAFLGILVAFYRRGTGPVIDGVGAMFFGDILALCGGASWAATTVVIRCSRLSEVPATQTLLYQLLCATAVLFSAAFLTGQARFHPSSLAWASLFFQAFIVSFVSFLVWFWMLRKYLASRLGTLSFMTPLFGVAFAVWLLKEPLDVAFLLGSGMVLMGIFLVSSAEPRRKG
jgi:drug/metabolite transporter (DMT)-like permease